MTCDSILSNVRRFDRFETLRIEVENLDFVHAFDVVVAVSQRDLVKKLHGHFFRALSEVDRFVSHLISPFVAVVAAATIARGALSVMGSRALRAFSTTSTAMSPINLMERR